MCSISFVTKSVLSKNAILFLLLLSRVKEKAKGGAAAKRSKSKRKRERERVGRKKKGTELALHISKKNFGEREEEFFAKMPPAVVALRAATTSARMTVTSAVPRPGGRLQQQQHAARRPPALVPTPAPSMFGRRRVPIGRRLPPVLSPLPSTGSGEHAFGPGTGRLPREELAGPIEILKQASVDLRAAGSSAIEAFRRRNDAVVDGGGEEAEKNSEAAKKGSAMGNSKFLPMVLL